MSLTATIPILIIVIIRFFARHYFPPKTFLVLWGIVCLLLIVPFHILFPSDAYTPEHVICVAYIDAETALNMPFNNLYTNTIPEGIPYVISVDFWVFMPLSEPALQISPILILWFVCAICLASFFIINHLQNRKEYMSAVSVENPFIIKWLQNQPLNCIIQIRQSDRITSPISYGIRNPVILFPKNTNWQDERQLHYILTHELAHITQVDVLIKWLFFYILCIHWFNPFIWIMYILINRDIEIACDETVVRTFGEKSKSAYALTLISMEEQRSGFGFVPLCNHFAKNAIEERIRYIMKMKKYSKKRSIYSMLLVILLIAIFSFGTIVVHAQVPWTNEQSNDVNVEAAKHACLCHRLSQNQKYYNVLNRANFTTLGADFAAVSQKSPCEFLAFAQSLPLAPAFAPCCSSRVAESYVQNELTIPFNTETKLRNIFGHDIDFNDVTFTAGTDVSDELVEKIRRIKHQNGMHNELNLQNLTVIERYIIIDLNELGISYNEFLAMNKHEISELASPFTWQVQKEAVNVDARANNYEVIAPHQICLTCWGFWCGQWGRCRGINIFVDCHAVSESITHTLIEHIVIVVGNMIIHGPCRFTVTSTAHCTRWGCNQSGVFTSIGYLQCSG